MTTETRASSILEHITDQVVRIPLRLPMDDLHSVNCYAVLGADGITVIDPGWASDETAATLTSALGALGHTLDDVVRVLATHHHWDHYTQAVVWKRDRGIPVALGHEERHSIRAWDELDGAFPVQAQLLRRAGAHKLANLVGAMEFEPHELAMSFEPPTTWLDGGEQWDLGQVQLHAVATPGHTRGHVVFEDAAAGLYFTGDHILPRITPSIAYERQPDPMSLRSYLGSLRLFLHRPDGRQLPAHGAIQDSTRARAEEILEHHASRLTIIGDLVASGSTTAHDIALGMRWTRHDRTLTELGTVHAMAAILEVAAHLELLLRQGRLERTMVGGVERYSLA